ncbi:MAG: hypothetical protein WKG01_08405 [Kofleriaceae bacterium]
MRTSVPCLLLLLIGSPAVAGSRIGGGGGALSQVTTGIGAASGSSTPQVMTPGNEDPERTEVACFDRERVMIDCPHSAPQGIGSVGGRSPSFATADFYVGAQKVQDSDGAVSFELVVRERRFRLTGALSHYFESQPDGGRITMWMPSIAGGYRIDDLGPTSVVVELGVVSSSTQGDPMGNSSITGPLAGLRVEHSLKRDLVVLGSVQNMWFPDGIRAQSGRVGVRVGHVLASVRVIDFNVGPPLYGPEVGMSF